MSKIAFIANAADGLGQSMAAGLVQKGWFVFAGFIQPGSSKLNRLFADNSGRIAAIQIDLPSNELFQAASEEVLLEKGHIDLLINNMSTYLAGSNGNIREELDFNEMEREYNRNVLGQFRLTDTLLSLINKGEMKRICFFTSKEGSISYCSRISDYGYSMSIAAMNMSIAIMFNRLRPEGYTFRVYDPGYIGMLQSKDNKDGDMPQYGKEAAAALMYFLRDRFDNRLVIRDRFGLECPW